MTVTEVRLKKREDKGKILASGSFTLDGEFVVSGIKVIRSEEGNLFIAYPSWKNSDGGYVDVCFPLTKTMREDITVAVLAKYEEL